MAYTLIKALKKAPHEKRRAAAIALAQDIGKQAATMQTETDLRNADLKYLERGTQELVKMVECGKRTFFSSYDYQDAYIGIEALGETLNPFALAYLLRIHQAELHVNSKRGENRGDTESGYLEFPNASQTLSEHLSYATRCTYPKGSTPSIDHILSLAAQREPHRTINEALTKVREAFAKACEENKASYPLPSHLNLS